MNWTAIDRYGLHPAPDTLGFVHNLLNTQSAGRPREPDLLADLESAQLWADSAVETWSARTGQRITRVVLDEADLEPLRDFRADLLAIAARHTAGADASSEPALAPAIHSASATLQLGADGHIRLEPRGSGWRVLVALAMVSILRAQTDGTWGRLKACRNPRCQGAFYDRSRNNSAVWHDVKVCGNQANLRAHRARKRAEQH